MPFPSSLNGYNRLAGAQTNLGERKESLRQWIVLAVVVVWLVVQISLVACPFLLAYHFPQLSSQTLANIEQACRTLTDVVNPFTNLLLVLLGYYFVTKQSNE